MQVFIPALGTKLILTEPWEFKLHREYRNKTLWKLASGHEMFVRPMGVPAGQWNQKTMMVHIPAGTVLTVDRVFIRKGAQEYDSVTFRATLPNPSWQTKKLTNVRFWVKLEYANNIQCEVVK